MARPQQAAGPQAVTPASETFRLDEIESVEPAQPERFSLNEIESVEQAQVTGPADRPTFGQTIGRGVDLMQSMLYGGVEAAGQVVGADGLERFGREGRERNRADAEKVRRTSLGDVHSAESFGAWVKETVGEQIPMMAPSMAGAAAGAAIGSVVPVLGTTLGGIIGAFVPALSMGVGEVQGQIKDKDPNAQAAGWAFLGGTAIAALDTALPGKIGSSLVRKFGREVAEEVAARALAKPLVARTVRGAAEGIATEGVTEAIQAAISEVAAARGTGTPIDPNLAWQMLEEGAAGALMGGLAGGVTAAAPDRRGAAKPPINPADVLAVDDPAGAAEIQPPAGAPVDLPLTPAPAAAVPVTAPAPPPVLDASRLPADVPAVAAAPVAATPEPAEPEVPAEKPVDELSDEELFAQIQAEVDAEQRVAPGQPFTPIQQLAAVEPGGYYTMSPEALSVDPQRFQFKSGVDPSGVTQEARIEGPWNPNRAGTLLAWRDPETGRLYVVNGHHRLEAAKRLGADAVAVKVLEDMTAEQALVEGALTNIAEDKGTAIDAAKVLRTQGYTREDLAAIGISPRTRLARDGSALAQLSDPLFQRVATGELEQGLGVAIGDAGLSPESQAAVAQLVETQQAKGRMLTPGQLRSLIQDVSTSPEVAVQSEQGNIFTDLLGEERAQSVAIEKAALRDWLMTTLARDRQVFGYVTRGDRAIRLQEAGNVIDTAQSKARAEEAAKMQAVVERLAYGSGPINTALNDAASRILRGAAATDVRNDLLEAVRAAVAVELGQAEPGAARPGGRVREEPDRPGPAPTPAGPRPEPEPVAAQEPEPAPALPEATIAPDARAADDLSDEELFAQIAAEVEAERAPAEPDTAPEQTPERSALIERIVQASRKPLPTIIEAFETKGTDGKWYRTGVSSMPWGVRAAEPREYRSIGWVQQTAQGTTVGSRYQTHEAAVEALTSLADRDAQDFRQALEQKSDAELQASAEHWLKIPIHDIKVDERVTHPRRDGVGFVTSIAHDAVGVEWRQGRKRRTTVFRGRDEIGELQRVGATAPAAGDKPGRARLVRGQIEVSFAEKPSRAILDRIGREGLGFRWGGKRNPVWTAPDTPERRAGIADFASFPNEPAAEPTPVTFSAEHLEQTFGLTPEQAEAGVALADAMDIDTDKIRLVKGGTPGASAMPQDDILSTGERQPRLPGDVGAVRDREIAQPQFDLPAPQPREEPDTRPRSVIPDLPRDMTLADQRERAKRKPKQRDIFDTTDTLFQSANATRVARWYYSNIAKALDTWQTKGTADQLEKHILKFKGAAEEAETIGLAEWLADKRDRSITRDEARAWVEANQIQVQDVTKDGPSIDEKVDFLLEDDEVQAQRRILYQHGLDIAGDIENETAPPGLVRRYSPGEVVESSEAPDEAQEAYRRILNRFRAVNMGGEPKYRQYQLPGGENYREVLLTLPAAGRPAYDPALLRIERRAGPSPAVYLHYGDRSISMADGGESDAFMHRVARLSFDKERLGPPVADFASGHWEEPNVLAHIRLNDRTVDGKRVLFVEEIQSDWHQKGRKVGYKPNVDAEVSALREEEGRLRDEIARVRGEAQIPLMERLSAVSKRLMRLRLDQGAAVPDAPFKGHAWKRLALKRVLALAAEGGYDGISWTTGAQQNDRYRLSARVDSVGWVTFPENGGTKAVSVRFVSSAAAGRMQVERGIVQSVHFPDHGELASRLRGKPLEDVLGKELAGRIDTQDDGRLEGTDLDLGGSGMVGFYDRELPNLANELVKKHGIKVGRADMEGSGVHTGLFRYSGPAFTSDDLRARARMRSLSRSDGERDPIVRQLLDVAQRMDAGATFQSAIEDPGARANGAAIFLGGEFEPIRDVSSVHYLDLPLALREEILDKGLPLFQGEKAAVEFAEGGKALIRALAGADISSVAHELAHVARRQLFDRNLPAESRAGITDEDIATAEAWAGVTAGQWHREAEEKFARGFERYLQTGQAPTPTLKDLFDKFKAWLTRIYESIAGSSIDVEITPEMRKVFDRLVTRKARLERTEAAKTAPKIDVIESRGAAAARFRDGDRVTYSERPGRVFTVRGRDEGDRIKINTNDGGFLALSVDPRNLELYAETLVQPDKPAKAPKPAPKPKKAPASFRSSDWTEIGKNMIGQTLYEDQRGVRSYIENGVRQTEPVALTPTRGGVEMAPRQVRDDEYKLAAVHPTQTEKYAAEVEPSKRSTIPIGTSDTVEFEVKSLQTGQTESLSVPTDPSRAAIEAERQKNAAERDEILKQIRAKLNQVNVGVDPEMGVLMVKLVRTYIKDGILEFREVALNIQEALGPAARTLDRHLELAWKRLRGETVSVEDALAADGRKMEEGEGADELHPGSGEGPDGGRDAAGGRGVGSEGALGTLPAEDSGLAAPAGAGSVRDGDSSGVLASGVGDRPDAGAQPAAPPGPGGRVVAGNAVSPSGAVTDPGHRPADYSLTPERIEAIVSRGPLERAQDNVEAIRIVAALAAERRHPTTDEQAALAKYVGWGASDLAQYLQEYEAWNWRDSQKALWRELQALTTPEQRRALADSTINAHYTYGLYVPIWEALRRAGFEGGRVLEPAVGTGHALGLMPDDIRAASTLNASELEPITAAIAQALYPSARVQPVGYQHIRLAQGTQDLVISNVPFGAYGVDDQRVPEYARESIHNYFFARALDHVRPGGLIVFVTSRYTLDGPEAMRFRKYVSERAHFLGAVRLPNSAFDKTAKTEVITDIVVLQRLRPNETAQNADLFVQSPLYRTIESTGRRGKKEKRNVYRSAWYGAHPELVIGEESTTGTMYGPGEYTVTAPRDAVADRLAAALAAVLPEGAYQAPREEPDAPAPEVSAYEPVKPGDMVVDGGRVYTVDRDGVRTDVTPLRKGDVDKAAVRRVEGLIAVRDAMRETIAVMSRTEATDAEVKRAQHGLKRAYTAFTNTHGHLNDPTNRRLFAHDPDVNPLMSLEVLEPEAKITTDKNGKERLRVRYNVVGLSEIFTKRTIKAPVEITHVDTPLDGLMTSLSVKNRIDWKYIARLVRGPKSDGFLSVREVQAALLADGHVFEQPDGTWATRDDYLSGDVVTKLADAEAADQEQPGRFAANVAALTAVQPTPKALNDIEVRLGAHWVPQTFIARFLADQLELDGPDDVRITLDSTSTYVRWTAEIMRGGGASQTHPLVVRYGPNNREAYDFLDLFRDALNLNQPSLGWWEGRGDDRHFVKDPKGTMAARANLEQLQAYWTRWVYANRDAQDAIVEIYNTRFNRTVKRQFAGAHLQTVLNNNGLALPFNLHPHQLNAIYRANVTGNTLLAHEVGAGKTFEMIAIAMEMRRLGRARKPMITVPTYLLSQWKRDILKAYPKAKLLAFEEKDLEKDKRQQAMARIAFGDWDIVLVPHSSFQLLKVSDARMVATMQEWIQELMAAEAAARARDGKAEGNVKKIAQMRKRIEDKVARKLASMKDAGKDKGLTWEELGVDALLVDEAHAFKNLFFFSKLDNLRGLSKSEADKALDMYVKVKEINEQSGERNIVFATATPVMNSMAELYTMQRYLQPTRLREHGLENFDNWYQMFALAKPSVEKRPDGQYQEVMRLKDFQNLRLLYQTLSSVMDYVGWEDMPYLKLPAIKGGKIEVVQTDPHPIYPKLEKWFGLRMANVKAMPPHVNHEGDYIAPPRPHPLTGEDTGALDNILTIMTDAKKAAIDPRLILGNAVTDYKGSRIQLAAKRIGEHYRRTNKQKGTALVFLDYGTPKAPEPLEFLRGVSMEDQTAGESLGVEDLAVDDDTPDVVEDDSAFNLYEAVKEAIVKQGVPSREIAFIHQARNPAERLALFQAVNEGRVRVLVASTDKGGVGMNVQQRLGLEVDLDAPMKQRPGDVRQRMGRIVRQGNENAEVEIVRYVTKGTTDEWLYSLIGEKHRLITQFMRGEADAFSEVDVDTMSVEEAQIRATGDPRGLELINLKAALPRLEAQATAEDRAIGDAKGVLASSAAEQERLTRTLGQMEPWVGRHHVSLKGEDFRIDIEGARYTKRADATAALREALGRVWKQRTTDPTTIGSIGGLDILAAVQGQDVVLEVDGAPFGWAEIGIASLSAPKEGGKFGEGQDPVAMLVNRYQMIPNWLESAKAQLDSAKKAAERAQGVLDRPAEALSKLRETRDRAAALEAELLAEAETKDKAAKVEATDRKAEADRRKAEAQARAQAQAGPDRLPTSSDVPMLPEPATTTGATKALHPTAVVKALAAMVGNLPLAVGKVPPGARGVFKDVGVIRTRVSGDYMAQLHELGHAIDQMIEPWSNRHQTDTIAQELTALGERTAPDGAPARTWRREGVAEYVRGWLMEPDRVRAAAPEFTKAFEAFVASGHPVGKALADAQGQTKQYLALTPAEQLDVMIDFGDGKWPEWAEQSVGWALGTAEDPRNAWDRVQAGLNDDKYRLWEMERQLKGHVIDPGASVYWLFRLLPGAVRRAEGFIKFKVRDAAGHVLGPGLDEALRPRLKRYKDIVRYMVAQRAERAAERGIFTGISARQAEAGLALGQYAEVKAAADGIARFRQGYLDYLVSEGFLSPDARAKWEQAWGDTYIPFKRVSDRLATAVAGAAPRKNPRIPRFFRRFRGGGMPIVDPLVTLVEDVYAGVSAALENKAMRELFALADRQGGGQFLEIVPADKMPVQFNLQRFEEEIRDSLAAGDIDIADALAETPDLLSRMVTLWMPSKFALGQKRYISMLEPSGERVFAEVHDEGLWELVDKHGAANANMIVRLFAPFSRAIRATATLNIPWMARNVIKDYFTAHVYSPTGYSPADTLRGLKAVLTQSEDWQVFLHSLAGQSTFTAQDRDVFKRELRRFNQGKIRRFFDMAVFHPFDTLAALRELSEMATRVGATSRQMRAELDETDGLSEAAIRRIGVVGREVTQDYHKVGAWVREWNQMVAFLSARIGGVTRAGEEIKANPGRVGRRVLPYMAMAIALWLLTADDDEYDAIPSDEKRIYHHIPVPQALRDRGWGPFVRIPRPYEFGDAANAIEAALELFVKEDPQAMERMPFSRDALLELVLSVAPDIFVATMEVAANYDTFRRRPIVSPYDTGLDPELQYNRWTSETAKAIGGIIGVAPAKLDHMFYSYGTSVYRMIARGVDRTLSATGALPPVPSKGIADWPVAGDLITPFYTGRMVGTADLDEFYTEIDRLEGAADSVRRYVKGGERERAQDRAAADKLQITRRGEGPNAQIVVMSPRLRSLRAAREQLRDLRAEIDAVYRHPTRSPREKQDALNRITERMVNIARRGLGKAPMGRSRGVYELGVAQGE